MGTSRFSRARHQKQGLGASQAGLGGFGVGARNVDGLLRGGKLLLGGVQITFSNPRRCIHSVKLKLRDVTRAQQRAVAFQVALRSFVGGSLGGNIGLGLQKVCGGRLFQLSLGSCEVRRVRILLCGCSPGVVNSGFASQRNLQLGGIRGGLREEQRGLGFVDAGFVFARINLNQDFALLNRSIVVNFKFDDIPRNLRRDGCDVAIQLGVGSGHLPCEVVPRGEHGNQKGYEEAFRQRAGITPFLQNRQRRNPRRSGRSRWHRNRILRNGWIVHSEAFLLL